MTNVNGRKQANLLDTGTHSTSLKQKHHCMKYNTYASVSSIYAGNDDRFVSNRTKININELKIIRK